MFLKKPAKPTGALSVKEILTKTYDGLKKQNLVKEITLEREAFSEIAADSDWHRTRKGEMIYRKVAIIKIGENLWAISRGEETVGYPADRYRSDLWAMKIEPDGEEKLLSMIESSSYFDCSLIIGKSDGNLATSYNLLSKKLGELLRPNFSSFIAKKVEHDPEHCYLDLRPVIKSPMFYKEELVDFLVSSIIHIFGDEK